MTKKALVVEGGAMRGIFASGVLDTFMKNEFMPYDFVIGVSAGASNLLGYLANSPKRSFDVITKLATNKRFFSPMRFFRGGNLVDIYPLPIKVLYSVVSSDTKARRSMMAMASPYRILQRRISFRAGDP